MKFEQLPPEVQELIAEANTQVNRTAHPVGSTTVVVFISRPFSLAQLQSAERERPMPPPYKAHFKLEKPISEHMGRYVFDYLEV